MIDNTIAHTEILSELERILLSPLFLQSERLARFLRFTVEQTLQGEHASLKEVVIGTQVYDRKPSYNPNQDSIVRTEARRLRGKLKEYYEGDGRLNPVYIYFRPGSYVPVFRMRHSLEGDAASPRHDGIPIAVVPFTALSEGSLASACALGISDELIHTLMRTKGCRVVAASSIVELVAQAADIPTLAQRLGAQFVFDGSVQHVGSRIRIHARLVSADGLRLWSQRFEVAAEPGQLFEIQERVVSALLTRTAPRLALARAGSPGTAHVKVYPDLLAAEEILEEGTLADLPRALQTFRRLADLAPQNARIHVGISQTLIWLSQRGAPDSQRLVEEAQQAAARALELDGAMVEAHSALACTLAMQWQWPQAEASFQRALDPGWCHAVMRQYAGFLGSRARFDEAWHYYAECQKLDSFSHRFKASLAHFFFVSRRYQDGLDYFARLDPFHDALRYGTMPAEVHAFHALSLVQLGRHEQALAVARVLQEKFDRSPLMQAIVAEIYAASGLGSEARTLRNKIEAPAQARPISAFRLASLSLALGEPDVALGLLESSFENREAELPWIAVDSRFDVLRHEERFHTLLTRIG